MNASPEKDFIVGTWVLRSVVYMLEDGGEAEADWGEDPIAMIIYDAKGNVAHQLSRSDRARWKISDRAQGTPEEIKAAFESYIAYIGTYEIDWAEQSVTHTIKACLFPNWIGTQQKRFFTYENDRLTLRTIPYSLGGQTVTGSLIWERAS